MLFLCQQRILFRKEFIIGTVLYKTKSLHGTKPKTNTKTNPNPNPIQLYYAFFEHRPIIFKLASFVRFSRRSNMVLLPLFSCTIEDAIDRQLHLSMVHFRQASDIILTQLMAM